MLGNDHLQGMLMRSIRLPITLVLLLVASAASAQDLAGTCHASSSYDVTVLPDSVMFDRPTPQPTRVQLQQGTLRVDGAPVKLNAENQDRLALFERTLRALVPNVRTVADHGADIAVQTLREQAGQLQLGAATRSDLNQRLTQSEADLKQRIARSHSTRDWQGDVANQYASQISSSLLPPVVADLGQQAITAAMSGDLQGAADLRDRATGLATSLQPLLQQRMQALRPQIEALCPTIQKLAELQQGVRDAQGRPLNLLQVDAAAR